MSWSLGAARLDALRMRDYTAVMRALPLALLCAGLAGPALAESEARLRESLGRFKAGAKAVGRAPAAAGLPSCAAGAPVPPGGCLAPSDLENAPGRLFRHPRGWTVHESCFGSFAGEDVGAILDEAWRKIDPALRLDGGGCLGEYNPRWAHEAAGVLRGGRVLLVCSPGTSCAATSFSHRYRGAYGPEGFRRASPVGEKWATIGLQDVVGCRDGNRMSFASIVFHETLHAAGAPVVNPLAHDASWRTHDPSDVIYSAQAVCFEGPGSAYGTTGAQCRAVVERGGAGAAARRLCARFTR